MKDSTFVGILFVLSVVWAMMLMFPPLVRTEPAPYQVYKVSYGCLYVVYSGNTSGGVAAVVTPAVNGKCQ